MKKSLVFSFVLWATFNNNFAQNMRPLTGNGTEKKISYDIQSFDVLEVLWLDGKIEVEFGAPKSDISITTDENIFNLLKVMNNDGVLKLEIANNFKNRLWLEDDKTIIKIRTTAQPRQITYKANANAFFRNINSPILSIIKDENGDLTLEGKVAILQIEKQDNGSIKAENLRTEQASVSMTGNGDVSVNAQLLNKRKVIGNGSLSNKMEDAVNIPISKIKRVNITFYNPDTRRKEYYVTGTNERGLKFSYGLELKPMEKQSEYLPIGTQIFRKGILIATLKEGDEKQEVRL